ncbi:dGTP triphosphohydrolase [Fibrobacter sp.]|uniref:dGTP triphosphohydrolase n=1 Tax=Fibrobacter sp. TaxID=35828 RepID=UPI0038658A37
MDYKCFAAQPSRATRFCRADSPASAVRDNYQVDRDRILYSKAFRRLRGKTQVFIAGYDDHVRNRLSHTLEVSQIARTISKALGLNEMLTEAIALGHDLGHTPFGHVGERILHDISCGKIILAEKGYCHEQDSHGFKHNWQSVRVACNLEFHNRLYAGLNLTKETLWGFLNHSNLKYKDSRVPFYEKKYGELLPDEKYWSFEAIVVSIADEIAQRHHDIEDGLITGILERKNLIKHLKKTYSMVPGKNVEKLNDLLKEASKETCPEFYFELLARSIVNFYVCEVVSNTKKLFGTIIQDYLSGNDDGKEFYAHKKEIWNGFIVSKKDFEKKMMSEVLYEADAKLQNDYFSKRILLSYQAQKNDGKAAYVIKKIVEAYLTNPQQMPDNAIILLFMNLDAASSGEMSEKAMNLVLQRNKDKADNIGDWRKKLDAQVHNNDCSVKKALVRTVIDYVAGMTDDYALAIYEQLYGGTKQNRY